MKIAVLGPKGTYSDKIAHQFETICETKAEMIYTTNMKQTLDLVKEIGYGICPIENTLEGFIGSHIDMLILSGLSIDFELSFKIAFSLVSHVDLNQIETIYVQYAAKNQCLKFIEKQTCNIVITNSNVQAYEMYQKDPRSAAVVPDHLVSEQDQRLDHDLADEKENTTRFLIVRNTKPELIKYHQNHDFKASIVVIPKIDRPGLLFDILKVFADEQINLISILSRPTKKKIGTYHFYIELEGHFDDLKKIQYVVSMLEKTYPLKLIGIYQKESIN